MLPISDWCQNKKEGDVKEISAAEIGRRCFAIKGTVSSCNYIQMPEPNSMVKNLGLTGRFVYFMAKAPSSTTPMVFHMDLQMADLRQTIRVSASNLYK
jgi:hypothetical protein